MGVQSRKNNLLAARDSMRASARFVAVVIPAHEEELRIQRCLESVTRSLSHPILKDVDTLTVVVLDGCADTTGERATAVLAEGHSLVIETDVQNVGASRALGIEAALRYAGTDALDSVWIATTDADSEVPANWIKRQLRWRARGADAVAGTVNAHNWYKHSPVTSRRFEHRISAQGRGWGHPHVHGANLSFDAQTYLSVGGFPHLVTAEDHGFWNTLQASEHSLISAGDLPVRTSTRHEGRAPAGFSTLLSSLAATASETFLPAYPSFCGEST